MSMTTTKKRCRSVLPGIWVRNDILYVVGKAYNQGVKVDTHTHGCRNFVLGNVFTSIESRRVLEITSQWPFCREDLNTVLPTAQAAYRICRLEVVCSTKTNLTLRPCVLPPVRLGFDRSGVADLTEMEWIWALQFTSATRCPKNYKTSGGEGKCDAAKPPVMYWCHIFGGSIKN